MPRDGEGEPAEEWRQLVDGNWGWTPKREGATAISEEDVEPTLKSLKKADGVPPDYSYDSRMV